MAASGRIMLTTMAMTSLTQSQASLTPMPVTCCVLQMTPVLTGHLIRTKTTAGSRILMQGEKFRATGFLVQSVTKVFGNFLVFLAGNQLYEL